jgi:type VI secretion system protein ImpG
MDQRLVRYYERELRHVRETAAEFARDFPKIAGRLSLDEFECADPYVERLLEGFAYLSARVQLKLDAEFPRFTQHLLDAIYPHYLCPTPSMCVVQIRPDLEDSGLASGFEVPRGTALRSTIGRSDQSACEYRTGHAVTLAPIELVEAQYHDRDLLSLDLPRDTRPAAVIRLRLRASAGLLFEEIETDDLALYLRGSGNLPTRLYERIVAHTTGILVRPTTRPPAWSVRLHPSESLRQMGFDDDEALLPVGPRTFQGYRHLQEYFSFPERFRFLEISGLRRGFERCGAPTIEILFLLDEGDPDLEQAVDESSFALHCTPAINLFPKRCDRIHVSDRFHEFHVVPDKTRPLDYEVYDITGVTGVGGQIDDERSFRPFYKASDLDEDTGDGGAFFEAARKSRQLTDRERRSGRRSRK